ncbi:MAG: hypothetical protein IKU38_04620 [Clostridia bacterium]|nr:hypothetical protein [Clostridia bacterium]
MKKRKEPMRRIEAERVIFREALMPMEAAILPAQCRRITGTLSMIPRVCDAVEGSADQRAKICVR